MKKDEKWPENCASLYLLSVYIYIHSNRTTNNTIIRTNNTIIECNLCALKKPNGETRRRNKRSCGKCILRAMYARDTLEQAYPGKYPWRDLCKIYIYI